MFLRSFLRLSTRITPAGKLAAIRAAASPQTELPSTSMHLFYLLPRHRFISHVARARLILVPFSQGAELAHATWLHALGTRVRIPHPTSNEPNRYLFIFSFQRRSFSNHSFDGRKGVVAFALRAFNSSLKISTRKKKLEISICPFFSADGTEQHVGSLRIVLQSLERQ